VRRTSAGRCRSRRTAHAHAATTRRQRGGLVQGCAHTGMPQMSAKMRSGWSLAAPPIASIRSIEPPFSEPRAARCTGCNCHLEAGSSTWRTPGVSRFRRTAVRIERDRTRWRAPPTPPAAGHLRRHLGHPVWRRNLVDEATALGAAVVGGVGVGCSTASTSPADVRRTLECRRTRPRTGATSASTSCSWTPTAHRALVRQPVTNGGELSRR